MSPIEKEFKNECSKRGINFKQEEQVSRYRVDFIDESRKLIVELDGHETHKSKEDRTYDAQRDRHLQREGYTVLRFTGSEIYKDVSRCADEVQQILKLREPEVTPDGSIYIDWQFFCKRAAKKFTEYKKEGINVDLSNVDTRKLFEFLSNYLMLSGRYDIHLFGLPSSFSDSIVSINTLRIEELDDVTLKIFEHQCEFLVMSLSEHLHSKGTIYKRLYLVADDPILKVELNGGRHLDGLIRLDWEDTNLRDIRSDSWQDVDIVIGTIFGLEIHEII